MITEQIKLWKSIEDDIQAKSESERQRELHLLMHNTLMKSYETMKTKKH